MWQGAGLTRLTLGVGGWGLAHRASVRDQRAKQWFLEVPLGTWSSWEDEAFTFQPNSGGPCDVTGCRALL